MVHKKKYKIPDWDSLANSYFEEVISPFHPSVKFRLRKDINHIVNNWKNKRDKVVMDFGCGCGDTLRIISGKVGLSIGLDISSSMLTQSSRKLSKIDIVPKQYATKRGLEYIYKEIQLLKKGQSEPFQTVLVKADMKDIKPLHDTVDLGIAINSISQPNRGDIQKIFGEITSCVKGKGKFISVFPSLDTMFHLYELVRKHGIDLPDLGTIKFPEGLYIDPSGEVQKYFTPDEITLLYKKYGWKILVFEKILYPWNLVKDYGWGYFPYHRCLWDWYVVAEKK